METCPNEIYDDRIHKCTFDIPIYLWERLRRKVRRGTKYNNNKSAYLRELLDRDLYKDRVPTQEEYNEIERTGRIYPVDPPRRYSGFIGGLCRNSFRLNWFRKKKEKNQYGYAN